MMSSADHAPCPSRRESTAVVRTLLADIDVSQCVQRDGLTLLYTGISPKRAPVNGKPPSSQNLRQRITYHYSGNAEGSTLRKTLGVLLADELGIELRRVGSGKRRTFGRRGEMALSNWMAENALVSWVVHPQPWVLERELIRILDVPLNLQDNKHNPFHAVLTRLRAEAGRNARELPMLDE